MKNIGLYFKRNVFEILLGLGSLGLLLSLIISLFLLFIVPIPNYHHTTGIIEFKHQVNVTMPVDGVINEVYIKNESHVKSNQQLFRYYSRVNLEKAKKLDIKKEFMHKEYERLSILHSLGGINKAQLAKKQLELDELDYDISILQKNYVNAPFQGKVYFDFLSENIIGTYFKKGSKLAHLTQSQMKHIRMTIANKYADRFKVGTEVFFKYKDPGTFKTIRIKSLIYKKHLDNDNNQLHLYADIPVNEKDLQSLLPYTILQSSIKINQTSFVKDFFQVDLFDSQFENLFRNVSRLMYSIWEEN